MRTFSEEPFTNDLGQVVNPGDEVFYIGLNCQRTSIRKGIYEGVFVDTVRPYDYKTRTYGEPQRRVEAVRVGNVPDKRWKGGYVEQPDGKLKYEGGYVDVIRKAILPKKRVYRLSEATVDNFIGKSF